MNLNKADKFKFVFEFLHNNFIDYFDTSGKSCKPQPNSQWPAVRAAQLQPRAAGTICRRSYSTSKLRTTISIWQLWRLSRIRLDRHFFLHGPGGTGKTYVYNILCYFLCGQGMIVLCVASLGIAALLFIGGQTAHSCFKYQLMFMSHQCVGSKKNSLLADLIKAADLVIWDEAPMQSCHIHKV